MAGIQILVVEDNLIQAKLARFLLEEAGHGVQIAETAERALEILQTFRPNLILMDLELPAKDGLELTRELRLNPAHGATPIVALTAYTDRSDVTRAREAGCNGHISKPIDTAAFAQQVRNFLGGASNAGSSGLPADAGDLLAEVRNGFLAEGLEQCDTILRELQSNPRGATQRVERILHHWAGLGGTLGFPEISNQARRVEALLSLTGFENDEVVQAIETARRRFCAATRIEPELPLQLIRGLAGVRIGLVNFSDQEATRMRSGAHRTNVHVVMDRIVGGSIEKAAGCGALIINESALSADTALLHQQCSVPAVFIGSRASLELLSQLPERGFDFVIAPWEVEEVLLRVHRLIASQRTWDSLHAPGRRPRVLIADDDADLLALVSATLGQFGMDVDIARSGQQTLDMVSRKPPDAVVLDVNMVDLDGFEVLKKLRHNVATKALPVLLLTARNQASDIGLGFGSGADDYMIKPFQPADLVRRVEKIVGASRNPRRTGQSSRS
jgi:two-component system, cell cycle response regulator DivK